MEGVKIVKYVKIFVLYACVFSGMSKVTIFK